jgi:hypothetical protein
MKDTISAQQIAGDLVYIHEKRINTYKQILHESANMERDMKSIFERLIDESVNYVEQLEKTANPDMTERGDVYVSWKKMKEPHVNGDRKGILAACANDELLAINTYSIALSMLADHSIVKLLERQQQGLKKMHAHIRQYKDAL